jgi:hypothetical protein
MPAWMKYESRYRSTAQYCTAVGVFQVKMERQMVLIILLNCFLARAMRQHRLHVSTSFSKRGEDCGGELIVYSLSEQNWYCTVSLKMLPKNMRQRNENWKERTHRFRKCKRKNNPWWMTPRRKNETMEIKGFQNLVRQNPACMMKRNNRADCQNSDIEQKQTNVVPRSSVLHMLLLLVMCWIVLVVQRL